MRQGRLSDAAIALGRVLTRHGIQFGIFGGCAVALNGGPRESKDLDLLAIGGDKSTLLRLLDGNEGFKAMPISRDDVVILMWNDKQDAQWVTVEIFVGVSQIRAPKEVLIRGETQGEGTTFLLDEVYLFKGKLRAAATRHKHSDAADLVWLEGKYSQSLRANVSQLNLVLCGLALRRYSHLHYAFQRIGIDVQAAAEAAKDVAFDSVTATAPGDVQRGILG